MQMEPTTTAALIGGGASLLGGFLGRSGVASQNAANAKQARLNREFQERMSSTAHQRAVTDLRKAGLNPILSATKGGASTPGGAQAQMQSELEPLANSAPAAARLAADLALVKAQTRKTNNEANITKPKSIIMDTIGDGIQGFVDNLFGNSPTKTDPKFVNTLFGGQNERYPGNQNTGIKQSDSMWERIKKRRIRNLKNSKSPYNPNR
ncbi:DNA pilot protein [Microviridae sp.]|nr:DNA pilot protein [Microviridae sp.]